MSEIQSSTTASVPYAVAPPINADEQQLNILAICHWIWGGLTCFFGSFGFIHLFIGITALNGSFGPTSPNGEDRLFAAIFICLGVAVVLFGWTMGILTIYSGFCLKKRRRWLFSTVMACVNCISMPIGTTLGIFTLIVLMRPSTKQLYAVR
jgi:hypothetical protein